MSEVVNQASLVADIYPGFGELLPNSSHPLNLTEVNGTLFFTANDGIHGTELWQVNQEGNAVLVADINPDNNPNDFLGSFNLTEVNGTLFFTANDGIHGEELWQVNQEGNAILVEDINPDPNGLRPEELTEVNGTLFFTANDGIHGTELWQVDAEGNATLVANINPGNNSSDPQELTVINGTLYFTADDGIHGTELWKLNQQGNPILVADINLGSEESIGKGSYPSNIIEIDGNLFFTADDGIHGRELWQVDAEGNATLVEDINPGSDNSFPDSSSPTELIEVNGTLYFTADDGINGRELWQLDAEGNPVLVEDIFPGEDINPGTNLSVPNSSNPNQLIVVKETLFFTADDGIHGEELWQIDAEGNAVLVADLFPGSFQSIPNSSVPRELTEINDTLFFTANDGINGNELWQLDAEGNPVLFADIFPDSVNNVPNSSYPNNLIEINGTLFFTANDGNSGVELWQIPLSRESDATTNTNLLGKNEDDVLVGDNTYYGSSDRDIFVLTLNPGNGFIDRDLGKAEALRGLRSRSLRDRIVDFESGIDLIRLPSFISNLQTLNDFSNLDTNGSGILDRADERISIVNGSTIIDFSDYFGRNLGSDTVTVTGATNLNSNDFLFGATL
jgi:ELWxxDGT repeat protein